MFKKDLKKTYHQFKLDPEDINLCGYVWNDIVFVGLVLVMGARFTAFLCQRVTDVVSYMSSVQNVNVINYLDDLCSVSSPEKAEGDYQFFSELLVALG